MKLQEYNEIVEKIQVIIERYNNCMFEKNNYQLYLANGDVINIRFPENRVAHLLGVNIEYLRNSNKFKPNIGSYDVLKQFIDESYSFSKLCGVNGSMNFDSIFSKHIHLKLDAFYTNVQISTADLLYIIKYDNERTYKSEDFSDVSDYYLIRKNKGIYYVLGIIKDENYENVYVPTTSRKYDSEELFNEFIRHIAKNQEITYPYYLRNFNNATGYNAKVVVPLDSKIKFLSQVINNAKKYNGIASTSGDFLFSINKSKDIIQNKTNLLSLLRFLSDNLKSGNVLESDTISEVIGDSQIDDEVKDLIDVCNNIICSGSLSNANALSNYSLINEQNIKMKIELDELKKQNETLKQDKELLENEKKNLLEQNNIYSEQFNIIEEACQKMKKN